jgi:TDG/mug DNA glycosylase family protein
VQRRQPAFVAFLGFGAYRTAFDRRDAAIGEQHDHRIGGTRVWLLPNPSGLNAHFQPDRLAEVFAELRARA